MAFKSFSQYQEDKNGDFFVLPNDKDWADVVFLYKSANDVLVADVHYLNTSSYKGYVHCCESGCPACMRNIDVQHKIFIPLYNITKNKIEFWDRTTYFEQQLQKNVFQNFPDPSQCVFRITRNGEANDRKTTYSFMPVGRNSARPYEKILADFGISFPDAYSRICKEMTAVEMANALDSKVSSDLGEYGYTPIPRGQTVLSDPLPEVTTPVYSEPPVVAPPMPDSMPEYSPEDAGLDSDPGSEELDNVSF